MSERDGYPAGVPCWVDTLQPDCAAARAFYAQLFQWEVAGPGPMPGDPSGDYYVARLRGRDVAGVGSAPGPAPVAWNTYVSVASLGEAIEAVQAAGGAVLVEPVDASPAGSLAVIADPMGAALGLWQPAERQGAQIVNEPCAWAMSMLHTPDPDQAAAFYGAVFGWRPEPFGGVTLYRLEGFVGGEPQQPVPRDVVAVMAVAPDRPSQWSVDFWIEDADTAAATAERLGGRVVAGPFDQPGFRSAVIADPQGAAFSVSQLLAAPVQ